MGARKRPFKGMKGYAAGLPRLLCLTGLLIGNCDAGELTNVGMNMLRELGTRFRQRYVDQLKFLPER